MEGVQEAHALQKALVFSVLSQDLGNLVELAHRPNQGIPDGQCVLRRALCPLGPEHRHGDPLLKAIDEGFGALFGRIVPYLCRQLGVVYPAPNRDRFIP